MGTATGICPVPRSVMTVMAIGSLLAVGLLGALAPTDASAWTGPRLITTSPGDIVDPALASGSTGITALSFTRVPTGGARRIEVAIKGPRKTRFGSPTLVSAPALEADESKVAVDPEGRVTVAWIGEPNASSPVFVVMVATKAPSARRFSRPVRLSPLGMNDDAAGLSISAGPKGRTVVAWAVENPAGDVIIQSARRKDGRSAFVRPSASQELSRPASRPRDTGAAGITALVTGDGSYNYLWTGTGSLEYLRSKGRVTRRQTVSSGDSEREGVMAVARSGAATIAWTNGQSDVRIARRGSVRARFSPRGAVSTDASGLGIGMARDGTTTIVYQSPLASGWQPVAITRRPSQPLFTSERFISPLGGYEPRVAVSPGGKTRVVFGPSESFLAPGVVERGPRASSFGSPGALSSPSSTNGVFVAAGGDGWGTAAWVRSDFGSQILYSVDRP